VNLVSTHRKAYLFKDWTWVDPVFRSASKAEEVIVAGCLERPAECSDCPSWYQDYPTRDHDQIHRCVKVGDGCKGCTALRRGLANSAFEQVRDLTLVHLAVDVSVILHIFQSCKGTLQTLSLEHVELVTGSWLTVFTALLENSSRLEDMSFQQLYQRLRANTDAQGDNDALHLWCTSRASVVGCLGWQIKNFTVKNLDWHNPHLTGKVFFVGPRDRYSIDGEEKPAAHHRPDITREQMKFIEEVVCDDNHCDEQYLSEEEDGYDDDDDDDEYLYAAEARTT
jgi:hypothetical protein